MKKSFYLIATVLVVLGMFISFQPGSAKPNSAIPVFEVVSVIPNTQVTIRTYNFPADKEFTVTMGKIGTLGVGGVVVATTNSGRGGSFQATYKIPLSLYKEALIAIRLQSTTGKYYAYNWFVNNSTPLPTTYFNIPTPTGTIYTSGSYVGTPWATLFYGYPYFGITGVTQDTKVSISGSNFPVNQTFNVLMGAYGSFGIGGTQVASLSTGSSRTFTASYDIPAGLKGYERIAIRLESTNGAIYAYNWFFNRTTGAAAPAAISNLSFSIQSVIANSTVSILSQNLPANVEYDVQLGSYGTQGINGTSVGTAKSSSGGSFTATYNIPAGLKGQQRIAIRLVAKDGSFAYNWFYNVSSGSN
jgi:hypothetical protein